MKTRKIVPLLIALLIVSLGYAQQTLIENFDTTPATYTFTGFEKLGSATIASDPASGGNRGNGFKLVSVSTGNPWQGAEVVLSTSKIRLNSTDRTMKVDVYSTQAFTMLGKVEQGGGATISATSASYTTPNVWQTLTFTFNTSSDGTGIANGDYAKIIFFPGRNSSNTGWATPANFTVYVDNITGVKVATTPDPAPTTAPTTPPVRNAADVISLFSNAYTNIPIDSWSAAWDNSSIADLVIAGNDAKKITFTDFLAVQFNGAGHHIDATPMTNFHIDLWTATATLDKFFNLKFSNWGGGSGEANAIQFSATNASNPTLPNPNPGTWISLDIPLSKMAGLRNDLAEFIISSGGPGSLGTVYVDNIYFWRDPSATGTPTISFTIPAKVIGEAPFSLSSPMITSNSAGAISYTSSNTAVATVSGSTVTIVGVGTTNITANQVANGSYNAASKTTTLDVYPSVSPVPQVSAGSVIGLYGETYNVTGYQDDFGEVVTADLDPIAGINNALKINFASAGYGQTFTTKDISTMQYVHFDYYTTDATTFGLYLMSGTATYYEAIYTVPGIVQNQWVSVNIPMSYFKGFPQFKSAEFQQFAFKTAALTPGTVYFDNLYLTTTNIVTSTPAPTASAQTFCGATTVASLVATGTDLKWYANATGGTALATSEALTTQTYYVSQTLNTIESDRTAVAVTVTAPLTTSAIRMVAAATTVIPTVVIGTQTWTTKNLDVATYSDGTVIPQVTDPTEWANLTTGAWCYYNNDPANGAIYGKLYNWYAVAGIWNEASKTDANQRKNLAPTGYHVASDAEWTTLIDYLGGGGVAGGKMKEIGTTHWESPNTSATNTSGFTALPGGLRYGSGDVFEGGAFNYINHDFDSWTSSGRFTTDAGNINMSFNSRNCYPGYIGRSFGFSVRCIKD